ncbi:hypothetical protein D3C81_2264260 [compost metagenome]
MALNWLADKLFSLINETYLYCIVAVVLNCFNLCNYTGASLENCYRSQYSVFIEDLCHSDLGS